MAKRLIILGAGESGVGAAILGKQKATLQQLEELEKAAEQIKVYTKRN